MTAHCLLWIQIMKNAHGFFLLWFKDNNDLKSDYSGSVFLIKWPGVASDTPSLNLIQSWQSHRRAAAFSLCRGALIWSRSHSNTFTPGSGASTVWPAGHRAAPLEQLRLGALQWCWRCFFTYPTRLNPAVSGHWPGDHPVTSSLLSLFF